MNTTTRYILTATAVGVGLFTVGATANALGGSGGPAPDPIGDPVVLPSASSLGGNSSSLEAVNAPSADDLDSPAVTPSPTGVLGDDEHGVEIEGGGNDD